MLEQPVFTVALVTRDKHELPEWVSAKAELSGISLNLQNCRSLDQLIEVAGAAQVVWTVGRNTIVTSETLPRLAACRAIMRSGSGLDDLPLETAHRLHIQVLNTPEAISETVAEHTVALLLALPRQIVQHDRAVRQGSWQSAPEWARWHACGQTLGLIGFGLIARHVVTMLQGFKMRFIAFDPFVEPAIMRQAGVEPAGLDELLPSSDFVSIHCPLTPQTFHLIGERELRKMRESAFIINTSRGAVIDQTILIKALRQGWISGAGLDVLEIEPPATDNPLQSLENVVTTPHIAAFSDQFEERFWTTSLNKLEILKRQWQDGEPPFGKSTG